MFDLYLVFSLGDVQTKVIFLEDNMFTDTTFNSKNQMHSNTSMLHRSTPKESMGLKK